MVVAGAGAVGEGCGDVVRLAARVHSRRGGGSASAESSSLSETVPSSSSSDEARPLLRPPRPRRAQRPRPRPRLQPPRPPRASTAAHRPPPRPAPRSPPTQPSRHRPRPPRLLVGVAASAADVVASSRPCNGASSSPSGALELAAEWPSASCSRRRISRAHHSRPSSEFAAAGEDQKAISARSAADLAKALSATVLATASRCRLASMREDAVAALLPTVRC